MPPSHPPVSTSQPQGSRAYWLRVIHGALGIATTLLLAGCASTGGGVGGTGNLLGSQGGGGVGGTGGILGSNGGGVGGTGRSPMDFRARDLSIPTPPEVPSSDANRVVESAPPSAPPAPAPAPQPVPETQVATHPDPAPTRVVQTRISPPETQPETPASPVEPGAGAPAVPVDPSVDRTPETGAGIPPVDDGGNVVVGEPVDPPDDMMQAPGAPINCPDMIRMPPDCAAPMTPRP